VKKARTKTKALSKKRIPAWVKQLREKRVLYLDTTDELVVHVYGFKLRKPTDAEYRKLGIEKVRNYANGHEIICVGPTTARKLFDALTDEGDDTLPLGIISAPDFVTIMGPDEDDHEDDEQEDVNDYEDEEAA
jgi:hypothetical protein